MTSGARRRSSWVALGLVWVLLPGPAVAVELALRRAPPPLSCDSGAACPTLDVGLVASFRRSELDRATGGSAHGAYLVHLPRAFLLRTEIGLAAERQSFAESSGGAWWTRFAAGVQAAFHGRPRPEIHVLPYLSTSLEPAFGTVRGEGNRIASRAVEWTFDGGTSVAVDAASWLTVATSVAVAFDVLRHRSVQAGPAAAGETRWGDNMTLLAGLDLWILGVSVGALVAAPSLLTVHKGRGELIVGVRLVL